MQKPISYQQMMRLICFINIKCLKKLFYSMNICIQILDVIDIIKEKERLSFPDATVTFYHSRTYKALQNTENALWAESAGYIAARSFICLSGKNL